MPHNRLEIQQTQKLSQSLQTVIHLLPHDLDSLTAEMLKAVQENPALEYVPPQKSIQDYAMRVKTQYRSSKASAFGGEDNLPDEATTTLQDLEQQLRLNVQDDAIRRAAIRLLHSLSSRGYFLQKLEDFAAEAGVSPQTASLALDAVQSLEPAGVGARSLEECLCLQLSGREDVDPLCFDLIRAYLPEIAKGNLKQIAKKTGACAARIGRCVDVIRALTPTPCSLDTQTVHFIMPEFTVDVDSNKQLSIQFLNDFYPTFRQDERFLRLADTLEGEAQAYARKMLQSASQMIHAVEIRQSTMEKIARIIVREQQAFFLGEYSLIPLSIADAAQEIGVHETTVYRAIQNKYLYCDRGTFPLSHFFQKEAAGGLSIARVKEYILEICRENDKMSDRAIAEALETRGVHLSRRTVAKYRAQMDIDSSFHRSSHS